MGLKIEKKQLRRKTPEEVADGREKQQVTWFLFPWLNFVLLADKDL
jgi:hypothetical protein